MTGSEFRRLRELGHLTVRRAATTLGVAPSTIQRWEGGAAIPSEAAEHIRRLGAQHAEHTEPGVTLAYRLGRLTAVLEHAAGTEPDTYRLRIDTAPATGLPRLIARAHLPERAAQRKPLEGRITELMAGVLPPLPATLTDEEQGQYWIGYYHERADSHHDQDRALAEV